MTYIVQYPLESSFLLSKSYNIPSHKLFVYPSGNIKDRYGFRNGWVYYDKQIPKVEHVRKTLHDYIISLNLAFPCQVSLKWLLSNPTLNFEKQIKDITNLDEYFTKRQRNTHKYINLIMI